MNGTVTSPRSVNGSLARLRNAISGCDRIGVDALRGLTREAGSFGAIGIANAIVDMVLFTGLHAGMGVGPLSAKIVSGLLTTIVSYYANRRWTWPHRPGADAQRRQLIQFTGISAVGLLIAEACLGVSHYLLGLHSLAADNLSANVIGLGLGFGWRFYASRRWVFTCDEAAATVPMNTHRAAAPIPPVRSWPRPAAQQDELSMTAPIDVSLYDLFAAEDAARRDHHCDTWRVA